jgi:fumarylacetoacetase
MGSSTDTVLRSFIAVPQHSHFPIHNLPYRVFRPNALGKLRVGVAIGKYTLDLSLLESEGFFSDVFESLSYIFSKPSLNLIMSNDFNVWHDIRAIISNLLRDTKSDSVK